MSKSAFEPVWNFINTLLREGFEKFGKYYSSYRGFVIENEDPLAFGRLKLVVPQLTGKFAIDYWAWPKGNFSGDGYGSQAIPRKGDMVWVEFEMGNARAPIWDYGHFAYKPESEETEKPDNLKDIQNFWFKTPGGHTIELDDTNQWIVITTSTGGKLKITDTIQFLEGESPAVLGDKNNDTLLAIKDLLNDISTTMGTYATNDAAPVAAIALVTGATLTYPAGIADKAADWATAIADIQTKIDNNNSEDITLK